MKCLALTSSTSQASIALGESGQTIQRNHPVPRGHSEFMNLALAELIAEAGWSFQDLDLIAVDQGPGSFTGIRVSVSIARSLCYSLGKPCLVQNSLEILSEASPGPVIAGLNAFKNLIFVSAFNLVNHQTKLDVLSPDQVESWFQTLGSPEKFRFLGDAWSVYQTSWSPGFSSALKNADHDQKYPLASDLLKRAQRSVPQTWTSDWKLIAPLYLRDSAAEENLRKL